MWIAVLEHEEDGAWFDEPVGGDTKDEVIEMARDKWGGCLPPGHVVVVYQCQQKETIASFSRTRNP